MSESDESGRTGRRALFTGTGSNARREDSLPISEITEIIRQINSGEVKQDNVSPIFAPVVIQLAELTKKTEKCHEECRNLTIRLLNEDEVVSGLKEDVRQLASERESYLNDLINSHTEFDRALEIFQYHEVPMVLTGPNNTVHDVNDAFCSLFSIARSEITTSHPPLHTYLPGETTVSCPDGEAYSVITLTPPVVPFDHEAESLIILIKNMHFMDTTSPAVDSTSVATPEETVKVVPPDVATVALEQLPIPVAIINQYMTIVRCNLEFSRLVAREKEKILLRDIGSCGIAFQDIECISRVLTNQKAHQCSTSITRPDNSEIFTYIEIIPIVQDSDEPYALIVGVESEEEKEPEQLKDTDTKSEYHPLNSFIHMLLDLNPSATALLDSNARVVLSNEGFSEITGLSTGDLTGTDVRDLGIPIPDSILLPGATEAQYLPGMISIQSAWGIQKASGMMVPVSSSATEAVAILVLQPIEEPAPTKQQAGQVVIEKQVVPDIDSIPVPYMSTDFSGKIFQVNKAFLTMSEAAADQVLGQLREKIISPIPDGLMNLTVAAKTCVVKEIISKSFEGNGNNGYWYLDFSADAEKTGKLRERISSLEKDLNSVADHHQGSVLYEGEISSDQIDIVEFELNHERYAIDITMVREVVEMLPITPLPRTPPYVIGIINLRGEVTHIIDLAILLGERPKKDRSGQKIIIIPSDVTRGEHVGIIVDTVQSVTEILGRHVTMLGEDITTQIKTHIKGIIKISRDDVLDKHTETSREAILVIWLDIQKILNDIQGTL